MLKNSYVFLASLQVCIEIESRKILDASNAEVIGTMTNAVTEKWLNSDQISEEDRAIINIWFYDLVHD